MPERIPKLTTAIRLFFEMQKSCKTNKIIVITKKVRLSARINGVKCQMGSRLRKKLYKINKLDLVYLDKIMVKVPIATLTARN